MSTTEAQDNVADSTAPSQKLIFILLAIASLCTTALIVLIIVYQRMKPATLPTQGNPAGGEMIFRAEPSGATQPPVMFDAPAFSLTERDDSTVTLDDLKGKVWVGNFIFTRCGGVCPMMTAAMMGIQRDLKPLDTWNDIRLVSFTVDPNHDTPEVLREFATRYEADVTHWLFLTGERQNIWTMVSEGFKLAVGEADENPDMPIMHSDKFVLVDGDGRIRGYYEGLEDEGRDALMRDLQLLMREHSKSAPAASRIGN